MYPDNEYPEGDYNDVAKKYEVDILEHEHETRLEKDHGPVYFLKNFPERTSPFWNMARNDDGETAKKVDVIIHGIETIGSAQRSCNKEMMRKQFNEISNGEYANTLFAQFSKERVMGEMNDFMSKEFFPRYGGGIGMTRMIRAMKMSNLI
jgi:aspartyl/asparaginyl-tRNA synthetase